MMKKSKMPKRIKRIFLIGILLVTYVVTLHGLEMINFDVKDKSIYKFLINNSSSLTSNSSNIKDLKKLIGFKPNRLLSSNLVYLEKKDINRYREIVKKLGLRK